MNDECTCDEASVDPNRCPPCPVHGRTLSDSRIEPCCYGMCVAGNQHDDDCPTTLGLRQERDRYAARVKLLEQRLAAIIETAEGRSVEEELDRAEAPSVLDDERHLRFGSAGGVWCPKRKRIVDDCAEHGCVGSECRYGGAR